jgi:hypothetical protein
MQVAPIVNPPDLAQLFIRVGVEPGALLARRVRQKNLGRETGNRNSGFFEELPALEQRRVDGQAASLCSLSFSVW